MSSSSLRLTLLAALLFGVALRATAAEGVDAALRAELEALRARNAQLEARNQELEMRLASNQSAVALASGSYSSGKGPAIAPGSSLSWDRAMKVATAARFLVPGSSLMTVLPTGSMKPMFDEHAILLMEPAPYDDLKVGDIVTFLHPKLGMPVVHRIVEKRGDSFWSKGDHNGRRDDVYITRQNYQSRVCGVIYSKDSPKR